MYFAYLFGCKYAPVSLVIFFPTTHPTALCGACVHTAYVLSLLSGLCNLGQIKFDLA